MMILLISLGIFSVLAIYITFPLIFHMDDTVTGFGDELIISWIQNWIIHSIFTNPLELFNTNLFYPYNNTIAYSDLHFTSTILSIIPLFFLKEPIVTFNFTVISSIIFVPFSIFILSWYLTKNYLLSLLSGILVQFSPAFLDKKVHIQVLALEWIPLSVLFFIHFHRTKKTRFLIFSMFFFILQTYNSFLPGYFLVFFYVIYSIYMFFCDKPFIKLFLKKYNIAVILITLTLIALITIPYYKASLTYNLKRDIRDAVHFAIQPEDLLYPNEHTKLQKYLLSLPFNQRSQNNEFKPGYLGLIFTLLIITVLFYFIKNFKRKNSLTAAFIYTSLLGLILSLGPVLHLGRQTIHQPFLIPLPYALFYYILPGFQGFRNSTRFEMMFILFIIPAISIILNKILKQYSLLSRSLIYLILIFGIIIEYNYPIKFQSIPKRSEFPSIYRWLNTTSGDSVGIIMPIYNWYMYGSAEEMKRDYYSTANWRRTINGASGFAPPQWELLVADLRANFPNKTTIQDLNKLGVNYIIIDKYAYDKEFKIKQQKHDGEYVINTLKKTSNLRFLKSLDNYFVFEYIENNK